MFITLNYNAASGKGIGGAAKKRSRQARPLGGEEAIRFISYLGSMNKRILTFDGAAHW